MTIHFRQELLQAVSELELRTRRNLSSLLAGDYRSSFRGSGMQFKEFRHYEPGDDIRHMSWAVTARTGKATVKLYEEERELDVVVGIDVSGSSIFGSKSKRKIDMYAELLSLIGLAAVKSGDKVGFLFFSDEPHLYLPPRRTRDQVMVGITRLLDQRLIGRKSNLRPALQYLQKITRTRTLIIVVSDFLTPLFEIELRALSQKHEVILLHCFDDAERALSISGVYEVWEPETGNLYIFDANSKKLKRAISQFQMDLSQTLETMAKQCHADYLALSVEDDYLQRLVLFFKQRGPVRC